jgi:uncharacterized glyoxalase superfamily protein PhnB
VKGGAAAIAFYQNAIGVTETFRRPGEDGKRVLHRGGHSVGRVSRAWWHACADAGEAPSVAVSIEYATPAEVDATFAQAVAAGANGWMRPEGMFWGRASPCSTTRSAIAGC